jgi:hypothetical protein
LVFLAQGDGLDPPNLLSIVRSAPKDSTIDYTGEGQSGAGSDAQRLFRGGNSHLVCELGIAAKHASNCNQLP